MKFKKYNILLLTAFLLIIIASFIITNNSYSKYTIDKKILIGTIKIIKEENTNDKENKLENVI